MKPEISDEVKLGLIDAVLVNYYETTISERNGDYAKGIIDSIDAILAFGTGVK